VRQERPREALQNCDIRAGAERGTTTSNFIR